MRPCSIEGCGKKYYAKGLCKNHYEIAYARKKLPTTPPMWELGGVRWKDRVINKPCQHEGCANPHWQHGYCRLHWSRIARIGTSELPKKPTKCLVEGCFKKPFGLGYCSMHYSRFKKGLSLTATRFELFGGEKNPNWKGGVADYPNHSLMKRIRIRVLKRDNYTCVYCGKPTKETHHVDRTKTNHTEKNMVACCHSCNMKRANLHKQHKSKYTLIYGFTQREMQRANRAYKKLLKEKQQQFKPKFREPYFQQEVRA